MSASAREEPEEVILATNPNAEGEATALYLLAPFLQPLGLVGNAPRDGLPIGGELDYADELTITKALEGRKNDIRAVRVVRHYILSKTRPER